MRMKKPMIAVLFVPVIFLLAFMMVSAGEEPWMDMKNCEMCKTLTQEDPALMKNMTWEHHDISNGLVSVSTVAPAFAKHFTQASERMAKVEGKLQKGEKVSLCNMCTEMGGMLQTGKVKTEHVNTTNGYVGLTTSDDPAMIAQIQKWGERTTEETMKMEKAEQSK